MKQEERTELENTQDNQAGCMEEAVNWDAYDIEDENVECDNPGGDANEKEWRWKRGLDIFGCLFALNICFVITSLPIVTIGASLTALYRMMFRIQKHDDYTVVKEYFAEFKSNFKRGTIAWLLIILAVVIMWGQYTYICNFQGGMATFYELLLIVEGVAFMVDIPFVFPLLAYFDNSVVNTFKNSFLLAISNLGSWLKIFITWTAAFVFGVGYEMIFLNIWYLWLLILFGLLTYISSVVAKKVFDKVKKRQVEKRNLDKKEAHPAKEEKKKKKKRFDSSKSIKEHVAVMDVVNGIKKEDTKEDIKE